jgi:hypothetical protein
MIQNTLISYYFKWQINVFMSSLVMCAFVLVSCSSDSGSSGGGTGTSTTPSNLVVSAVAVGTSTQMVTVPER